MDELDFPLTLVPTLSRKSCISNQISKTSKNENDLVSCLTMGKRFAGVGVGIGN